MKKPTRLMQKFKNQLREMSGGRNSAKNFHEDFNDHELYTGAIGSADIHRLKETSDKIAFKQRKSAKKGQ
jgi:hypothetical protein